MTVQTQGPSVTAGDTVLTWNRTQTVELAQSVAELDGFPEEP